jgi:hypothetical protein
MCYTNLAQNIDYLALSSFPASEPDNTLIWKIISENYTEKGLHDFYENSLSQSGHQK